MFANLEYELQIKYEQTDELVNSLHGKLRDIEERIRIIKIRNLDEWQEELKELEFEKKAFEKSIACEKSIMWFIENLDRFDIDDY